MPGPGFSTQAGLPSVCWIHGANVSHRLVAAGTDVITTVSVDVVVGVGVGIGITAGCGFGFGFDLSSLPGCGC